MKKAIWELLVPTVSNEGKPFKTKFHKVWDAKVRELVGGLTIMQPNIKGEWVSPDGEVFAERMIPVRLYCTAKQMIIIAGFTKGLYDQEAIMYYQISDNVLIYK